MAQPCIGLLISAGERCIDLTALLSKGRTALIQVGLYV